MSKDLLELAKKRKLALQLARGEKPDLIEQEATAGETFAYAFEKEGNLTRDFGDYLETIIPLGRVVMPWEDEFDETGFYASPVETYGEAWATASQDERRKMIINTRAKALQEEYGDKSFDEESLAYTAGAITKAVADPSTLIPFGRGVKSAMVVGGGLGGVASTADDLAEKGEVDIVDVARDTVIASAMSGIIQAGGQKVVNTFKNKAMRKRVDKAQEILDNTSGKDVTKALKDAGYTDKQIAEVGSAARATGKKLVARKVNKTNPEAEANALVTRHAHTQKDSVLDKALGSMTTRLMNINPALGRKMRQYEMGSRETFNTYAQQAEPFIKSFRALDAEKRKRVGFMLSNGDFDGVINLVGKDSPVGESIPALKNMLKDAGDALKSSGRVFDENPNYFPRLVKDYDKMSSELFDSGITNKINGKIREYAKKKGINVSEVTSYQKDRIANDVIRAYDPIVAQGMPSNLKQRMLKNLDEDVHAKYYVDADEALTHYISGVSHDIHVNKLFGKFSSENLDESIGALVRDLNLNNAEISDVSDILKARFQGGRQSASSLNQAVKNIGYMGTIGQFTSTVTQLGDLGVSSAMHGFKNTMSAFFDAVGNKSKIKLIDIAVDDEIMTEIASDPTLTSRLLNKVLTATGFKAVDRLGKESIINSSFKMLQKQAQKSPEKIVKKWGKYYGDDMPQLLDDLAAGRVTPLTKEHAFATLSDFQPISMSEMPEYYAKNPDARILYMLKSFTLKMWDVARKNIYNEWKRGNKKEAVQTMALLGLNLSLANTATSKIKDLMVGRDIEPENLPTDLMWNLLGVYGFSKYQADKAGRDGIVDTAFGMIQPPTPALDVATGVYKQATAEEDINDPDKNIRKVVRNIPVVGNIAANWMFGGAEAYNEKLREERYKD
jgi:hypothetical protein